MHSRIIMDVDDTISFHKDRDYENAIPNTRVIDKMRELVAKGIEFVLFTARGQISCDGDITKIESEKGPVLREWLEKHHVPYSELRFGKPIGDVYVDDAAMTPDEFIDGTFMTYRGGSNDSVERLGKFIVKECKSIDAVKVRDWFDKARSYGYYVPRVYSNTYNKIRMEYIQGDVANTIAYNDKLNIVNIIASAALSFASVPGEYEFSISAYKEYIRTNIVDDVSKKYVELACDSIDALSYSIKPSFCHGDLTTMNVIVGKQGICMIDPVPHEQFSSFFMDLAKLRMSVNGQNELFYESRLASDNKKYLEDLDAMLHRLGYLHIVKVLELTCWVRLIKYRCHEEYQYESLINRLEELTKENGVLW